jgi:Domain of unknown function (DUF4331)
MSSHREAPEISKDPVADSSDLYAFVSPDKPGYATIIANYVPLQDPNGGPNFFEFGDDVLYEIHISNSGDAHADITYGFRFHTVVFNKNTFLYNTGQIGSVFDPHFNRRQYYSVTRTTRNGHVQQLGGNLNVPPCNIGPRSTPNYEHLASQCVHGLPGNRTVFAGQRADAFHVDLGSVFDLLDLRPFQNLHLISTAATPGINSLANKNVHSIALRVPFSDLTVDGKTPTNAASLKSVVGIWTTASRQRTRIYEGPGASAQTFGGWEQVSRLGNPLINEVVIPMAARTTGTTVFRRTTPTTPLLSCTPRSLACFRSSTPACSRTWPRTRSPVQTWSRSWVPASRPASSPGSRTTRARPWPTCCASTWRSRQHRPARSVRQVSPAVTQQGSPTAGAWATTW